MQLTLIRHGEVSLQVPDSLYGSFDVNLSAAALEALPRVAQALAAKRPQVVLTSPLKRCATLARAVADLSGAKLIRDKRLEERAIGVWLHKTRSELRDDAMYQDWFSGNPDVHPQGGESLRMLQARVMACVAPLLQGHGALGPYQPIESVQAFHQKAAAIPSPFTTIACESIERVVWVSHGGVIRGWRTFVHGANLADSLKYAVSYFGCMEYERDTAGLWRETHAEYQLVK